MKIHPPDLVLQRLLLSPQFKTDPVLVHVSECSRCSHRLDHLRSRRSVTYLAYDAALSANARRLHELRSSYARERSEANGLVAELLKHPSERCRILVRNHPRFHTWGVFEYLIETARRESPLNPSLGEELASLALVLSEQLDEAAYGVGTIEDLRGRAWAYIGNARRVRSDLLGAQEALEQALVHLRRGTREPWERAVWLDLKASLLRAQRRFDPALRLLNRALTLFLAVGDRHRAGRILVNMDNVLHHAGRPEEGIPLLYRALELIDPTQEAHVLLIARHNLADDLAEAGRYMESQRLFIQNRTLYRRFENEPWIGHRRTWVEGKIARGLGQPKKAENLLLAAKAGFIAQASPYDTALVSLDLANLYAEQGRMAELKRLAEEMVPIFSSCQIHRETLAAFTLWRQAVQAEEAGTELAALIVASLRRTRFESQEAL
jgi:tetratricopeptide (TPR) repeat protein